jgi:hypothetical protein
VTGSDEYVVAQKAQEQQFLWNEHWGRNQEKESARKTRLDAAETRESKKQEAAERTIEAQEAISCLGKLLSQRLDTPECTSWAQFYDHQVFPEGIPRHPSEPLYDREPQRIDAQYSVSGSLLASLFPFIKRKRIAQAELAYATDHDMWSAYRQQLESAFQGQMQRFTEDLAAWQERGSVFEQKQNRMNAAIDKLKLPYQGKEKGLERRA